MEQVQKKERRLSRSVRRFIRLRKAEIRRHTADPAEQDRALSALREQFRRKTP